MSIKISQGESSHLGRCWDIYRDGIHNSCVYGALLCTSVLNTLNESIFHSYNLDIHFIEVERLRGISENNNKKKQASHLWHVWWKIKSFSENCYQKDNIVHTKTLGRM